MNPSRFFRIFIIFICCLIFVREASPGIMDDIVPISVEKEKKIGASIAKQVGEEFEDTDDPLIQKRFEEIGKRLACVSDRPNLGYQFKVLKAKGPEKERYYNAFAVPGGYVYMFDAMLEMLETDDKIAAVTAHEIGHICAKHSVKRLQKSLGANILMLLALVTARDGKSIAEANRALAQLMMAYSREDELEADRLSVTYMEKAEFDPNGVMESLLTLKELRKEGRERKYISYRTHPYLSERIAYVRTELLGYTDFDSYINLPNKDAEFR